MKKEKHAMQEEEKKGRKKRRLTIMHHALSTLPEFAILEPDKCVSLHELISVLLGAIKHVAVQWPADYFVHPTTAFAALLPALITSTAIVPGVVSAVANLLGIVGVEDGPWDIST